MNQAVSNGAHVSGCAGWRFYPALNVLCFHRQRLATDAPSDQSTCQVGRPLKSGNGTLVMLGISAESAPKMSKKGVEALIANARTRAGR